MKLERKDRSGMLGLVVLAVALATTSSAAAEPTHSDIYFDVTIRGTATSTIHADVWENSDAWSWAPTVLAVPGFTETGATFGPLAEAIFEDPLLKRVVKRIVAIDLPGRGQSTVPEPLPEGTLFGDLLIDDNVSAIIQAIDTLDAMGIGARVIMGHSMGGLEIQAAQEALLSQGSSLAQHGVYRAILLAPVPAGNVNWTQGPTGDPTPFIVTDPELGTYLDFTPQAFVYSGGYTLLDGSVVGNAPSVQEVAENGYVGIEPIATALQLQGQLPIPRPHVREGAFAPFQHGTLLSVVAFAQDVLVPIDDLDDLYVHLIGREGFLFRPVETPDSVHAMYISNPEGMLEALRSCF